ncbi:hypothetical protein [Lederbergia citrea]|uniref:hypothetical protein n=1 Tax=Lederbergia citrea TaxID=2833581 RepID=UPI001BC930F0|nr:hypothetical protein [Lederbergia citrea]MBS4179316.1 hypothetical protein [Lederbergia citrea]
MKSFIGLLKKEMLISRFWYITYLIIILVGLTGGAFFANRVDEPSMIGPMIIMFMPLQLFFLPLMVHSLLKTEGRTQLWLYNPQSSVKLLLAKVTTALMFQIISQILWISCGSIMMKLLNNQNISWKAIILTNVGLLSVGLYLTIWVIFLWTIYHSLGKFPSLRKFRWLAVLLVIIVYNTLETLFIKIGFIHDRVFKLTTSVNTTLGFTYKNDTGWTIIYEPIPVPILPIIFYTILSFILFIIASKLLDKKVEV